jgi:hypothetical protein
MSLSFLSFMFGILPRGREEHETQGRSLSVITYYVWKCRGKDKEKAWQRPTLPPLRGAVPSAREGLTSVFGMGTGGTPPLWSPDYLNHVRALQRSNRCCYVLQRSDGGVLPAGKPGRAHNHSGCDRDVQEEKLT